MFLAMNLAATQAMYPQTATHLPYHNGAIIQNPLQQSASIVRKIQAVLSYLISINKTNKSFILGIISTNKLSWSSSIGRSIQSSRSSF